MSDRSQKHQSLCSALQDDVHYMGNAGKDYRERWVLEKWCNLTGRNTAQATRSEAPDFVLHGEKIEIVEVLVPGRRRHSEFKNDLATLQTGTSQTVALLHIGPTLDTIISRAHVWVLCAIRKKSKKYGHFSASWTLLVYVNFAFADRTDWQAVTAGLLRVPPSFARIEVLAPNGKNTLILHSTDLRQHS